ncbi:hypothetical protein MPSEU_000596200 [Mayamaea pseudoterrestris]|nr:hypothetical protein MPSEU_000596200 [Mayamaea pseudoterrestris]
MAQRQGLIAASLVACCLLVSSVSGFAPPQHLSQVSRRRTSIENAGARRIHSPHVPTKHHLPQNEFKSLLSNQPASKTSLSMVAQPGVALAAITGALTAGFVSGGLHAIAGPDHLAALLPRCCGQRWYKAGRVGALWGMGHGVSATLIGILAFAFKSTMHTRMNGNSASKLLTSLGQFTEVAVGISLLLIGAMGLREAREWKEEIATPQPQSLSAAASDHGGLKTAQKRAVIFNGILHGFSWDGAPSLAPAIAVATWSGNLAFLSAYALGTMSTMALATTLIGEGTRRAGEVFQRPDIPQKLSFFSSILAMAIGGLWCVLAITKHGA